jgi:hypothetical protein
VLQLGSLPTLPWLEAGGKVLDMAGVGFRGMSWGGLGATHVVLEGDLATF